MGSRDDAEALAEGQRAASCGKPGAGTSVLLLMASVLMLMQRQLKDPRTG